MIVLASLSSGLAELGMFSAEAELSPAAKRRTSLMAHPPPAAQGSLMGSRFVWGIAAGGAGVRMGGTAAAAATSAALIAALAFSILAAAAASAASSAALVSSSASSRFSSPSSSILTILLRLVAAPWRAEGRKREEGAALGEGRF